MLQDDRKGGIIHLFYLQILMNAAVVLITVVLLQHAQTLLAVIIVLVTVVMLEMDLSVKVGSREGKGDRGGQNVLTFLFVDFNECGNHTDNCSAVATCINTVGSYNCSCNNGYIGNGFECEGGSHRSDKAKRRAT
jgi:hypothetical protein